MAWWQGRRVGHDAFWAQHGLLVAQGRMGRSHVSGFSANRVRRSRLCGGGSWLLPLKAMRAQGRGEVDSEVRPWWKLELACSAWHGAATMSWP